MKSTSSSHSVSQCAIQPNHLISLKVSKTFFETASYQFSHPRKIARFTRSLHFNASTLNWLFSFPYLVSIETQFDWYASAYLHNYCLHSLPSFRVTINHYPKLMHICFSKILIYPVRSAIVLCLLGSSWYKYNFC